jgi:hypothetical protein
MTEFNKSQWAKAEFTKAYRDSADFYIVERRRLLEILRSFYRHFIGNKQKSMFLTLDAETGLLPMSF